MHSFLHFQCNGLLLIFFFLSDTCDPRWQHSRDSLIASTYVAVVLDRIFVATMVWVYIFHNKSEYVFIVFNDYQPYEALRSGKNNSLQTVTMYKCLMLVPPFYRQEVDMVANWFATDSFHYWSRTHDCIGIGTLQ